MLKTFIVPVMSMLKCAVVFTHFLLCKDARSGVSLVIKAQGMLTLRFHKSGSVSGILPSVPREGYATALMFRSLHESMMENVVQVLIRYCFRGSLQAFVRPPDRVSAPRVSL